MHTNNSIFASYRQNSDYTNFESITRKVYQSPFDHNKIRAVLIRQEREKSTNGRTIYARRGSREAPHLDTYLEEVYQTGTDRSNPGWRQKEGEAKWPGSLHREKCNTGNGQKINTDQYQCRSVRPSSIDWNPFDDSHDLELPHVYFATQWANGQEGKGELMPKKSSYLQYKRKDKPLLLDLFCCAGGAGEGYRQAGFHVVGVDILPQPHNPHEFYQDDALEVLDTLLSGQDWNEYQLQDFAVIHASPECKSYTNCNLSPKENYQQLIAPIRQLLRQTGRPWVIENVMGAKGHLNASLMLCGSMFGLPMERHRLFESNVFLFAPGSCNHSIAHIGVYGHSVWDSWLEGTPRQDGKKRPDSVSLEVGRQAMQIPWMGIEELAEAIPPPVHPMDRAATPDFHFSRSGGVA